MIRGTVFGCVVAVLAPAHLAVLADEEKDPQDELPKAVSEAVKKKFPKAKVVTSYDVYSRFMGETKTLHGVQIKDGESKADLTVTPEGEILHVRKVITTKDLPKGVKTALDEKYPKATIKLVRESTSGKGLKDLVYHVQLVTKENPNQWEDVLFDPKGKVLSTSVGSEEVEEEKKKATPDASPRVKLNIQAYRGRPLGSRGGQGPQGRPRRLSSAFGNRALPCKITGAGANYPVVALRTPPRREAG
jgi:hypothetical protein